MFFFQGAGEGASAGTVGSFGASCLQFLAGAWFQRAGKSENPKPEASNAPNQCRQQQPKSVSFCRRVCLDGLPALDLKFPGGSFLWQARWEHLGFGQGFGCWSLGLGAKVSRSRTRL